MPESGVRSSRKPVADPTRTLRPASALLGHSGTSGGRPSRRHAPAQSRALGEAGAEGAAVHSTHLCWAFTSALRGPGGRGRPCPSPPTHHLELPAVARRRALPRPGPSGNRAGHQAPVSHVTHRTLSGRPSCVRAFWILLRLPRPPVFARCKHVPSGKWFLNTPSCVSICGCQGHLAGSRGPRQAQGRSARGLERPRSEALPCGHTGAHHLGSRPRPSQPPAPVQSAPL